MMSDQCLVGIDVIPLLLFLRAQPTSEAYKVGRNIDQDETDITNGEHAHKETCFQVRSLELMQTLLFK